MAVVNAAMEIVSPAFESGQPIPKKYTGEGEDLSPPLFIKNYPKEAKYFAIIMEDPDAPSGTFDHWIAWNFPVNGGEIKEASMDPVLGQNHFLDYRYRGPLPPHGTTHRYFFYVFALDGPLSLRRGASKKELQAAMKGHVLGNAELVGTYHRS